MKLSKYDAKQVAKIRRKEANFQKFKYIFALISVLLLTGMICLGNIVIEKLYYIRAKQLDQIVPGEELNIIIYSSILFYSCICLILISFATIWHIQFTIKNWNGNPERSLLLKITDSLIEKWDKNYQENLINLSFRD